MASHHVSFFFPALLLRFSNAHCLSSLRLGISKGDFPLSSSSYISTLHHNSTRLSPYSILSLPSSIETSHPATYSSLVYQLHPEAIPILTAAWLLQQPRILEMDNTGPKKDGSDWPTKDSVRLSQLYRTWESYGFSISTEGFGVRTSPTKERVARKSMPQTTATDPLKGTLPTPNSAPEQTPATTSHAETDPLSWCDPKTKHPKSNSPLLPGRPNGVHYTTCGTYFGPHIDMAEPGKHCCSPTDRHKCCHAETPHTMRDKTRTLSAMSYLMPSEAARRELLTKQCYTKLFPELGSGLDNHLLQKLYHSGGYDADTVSNRTGQSDLAAYYHSSDSQGNNADDETANKGNDKKAARKAVSKDTDKDDKETCKGKGKESEEAVTQDKVKNKAKDKAVESQAKTNDKRVSRSPVKYLNLRKKKTSENKKTDAPTTDTTTNNTANTAAKPANTVTSTIDDNGGEGSSTGITRASRKMVTVPLQEPVEKLVFREYDTLDDFFRHGDNESDNFDVPSRKSDTSSNKEQPEKPKGLRESLWYLISQRMPSNNKH